MALGFVFTTRTGKALGTATLLITWGESMSYKQINTKGWLYIKEWILATKNDDQEYSFDSRAAEAWCSEAEESMGNGNPPIVEMPANATISGSCETFTVPDDGILEIDEPGICLACNGSGEGMHEGTTCYQCKGEGEC